MGLSMRKKKRRLKFLMNWSRQPVITASMFYTFWPLVEIRRTTKIKLPDGIIAATAIALKAQKSDRHFFR